MKDIEEYKGIYAITDDGRVYSYASNKFLSPIKRTEYLAVKLCKKGKPKWHYIHRLVASALCENPNRKQTVNHIDGDHHNNRCDNLEWMTMGENNQAAWDNCQKIMTGRMIETMQENLALGRT
mgnify:FL=1|tara:strand:+ start:1048 stop:1416 length:369 start_codon:yes stop_codon:yes gene_type:complete